MAKFKAFPVPTKPTDTPLVTPDGYHYRCSGCGAEVPEGVWIAETIEDGMVVGLSMRIGRDGADVHQCGKGVPTSPPST
jgi:hypothetical protein